MTFGHSHSIHEWKTKVKDDVLFAWTSDRLLQTHFGHQEFKTGAFNRNYSPYLTFCVLHYK
jgi:hypothetical protein